MSKYVPIVVGVVFLGLCFLLWLNRPSEPVSITTDGGEETAPLVATSTESMSNDFIKTDGQKTALLANGCFWCVESDLEKVGGIIDVESGYAGGTTDNPTYENYASGGHREVVLVTYDSTKVTYGNLVEHIIKHGDPTDATGSFNDRGSEYAPAIYFETDEESAEARRVIAAVDESIVFAKPLPLTVLPRVSFWSAEDYHQNYAVKNPLRYSFYRQASGRSAFLTKHWGDRATIFEFSTAPVTAAATTPSSHSNEWEKFVMPGEAELRNILSPLSYKVTQEEGTEPPRSSELDKNYEPGIYVDILSGEPLFLSSDKYDSGTGWPSFVKAITPEVVTLHEDRKLFSTRTEVRSRYANSHLGHVFTDGPQDRGGMRYCMNGAALRFVPQAQMEEEGYGEYMSIIQ